MSILVSLLLGSPTGAPSPSSSSAAPRETPVQARTRVPLLRPLTQTAGLRHAPVSQDLIDSSGRPMALAAINLSNEERERLEPLCLCKSLNRARVRKRAGLRGSYSIKGFSP